jgi:DNA polymerase-3 subunit gamma/tau
MNPVLARRYRPQTFADVIGQEAAVQTLRNALAAGRVAHGFIFSGPRGVGKTTVARILAKAMNCRRAAGPTAEPCGECEACVEIREGNAVDVIEIDAASNRGIDEIRALRDNIRYRPARDRCKFYILDEAHQLTADAFNALLKTLEEPPEWAVFVLATTEPEALPATIRSRCQHFAFRPVPTALIRERMAEICGTEQVAAEPEALDWLAEAGEGSIRDALSLLDQAIAYGGGQLRGEETRALLGRVSDHALAGLMAAVAAADSAAVLAGLEELLATGVAPAQVCRQWALFVRAMLRAKIGAASDGGEAAAAAASPFSEEDLTRCLQILLRANGELRWAPEPRLHLELAAVKMAQARRLASVEDLLAALGGGPESGGGASGGPASSGGGAATPGSGPASSGGGISSRAHSTAAGAAPAHSPRPGAASATAVAGAEIRAAARASTAPARAPSDGRAAAGAAARPQRTEPGPAKTNGSAEPRAAVLAALAASGKTSAAMMLESAEWRWEGKKLHLAFYGEHAPLAHLVDQEDVRKALREACRAATGATLEIAVSAHAESSAAAASSAADGHAAGAAVNGHAAGGDELQRRAEQHPGLRQLREHLPPHHVLRTVEWKG